MVRPGRGVAARVHHHGAPRGSHSATGGPHDVRQGEARAGRSDLSPGSHGMFFIDRGITIAVITGITGISHLVVIFFGCLVPSFSAFSLLFRFLLFHAFLLF